jgi:uncharacterized membrane protein YqaE (UPF0057 family)
MFSKYCISLLLALQMLSHMCMSSTRPENKPHVAPGLISKERSDLSHPIYSNYRVLENAKIKMSAKGEKRFFMSGVIKKIKSRKFDDTDVSKGILLIIAVFFPYIAVGIIYGADSLEFFRCILYTLLLYLPGIIYAIYKVLEY